MCFQEPLLSCSLIPVAVSMVDVTLSSTDCDVAKVSAEETAELDEDITIAAVVVADAACEAAAADDSDDDDDAIDAVDGDPSLWKLVVSFTRKIASNRLSAL